MNKLIPVMLLVAASAIAQSSGTDGSWWKRLTPDSKTAYVSGYLSGAMKAEGDAMGTCFALWAFGKPIKEAYTQEQWKSLCFPSSHFDGGTIEQFRDGVEVFYSDFRNQKIGFSSAIEHVGDEIKGKPRAELDADLEHLRKCAADYTTCFASPASAPK
ncbi:MAG: hypothetical protein ABSA80_00405 [Terriglobales bacterium]